MKFVPLAFALLTSVASANPIFARTGNEGPKCEPRPPRDGKCWKDILATQWTVHGFDYHASYTFSTPAHQNSWGYVNFNLTNNVVPYTVVCSAASSQLTDFFYGTVDYTCTLPATAPAKAAVKFRFRGTFVVSGSTDLDLTCTDIKTENPDWQPGEIYSSRDIKCTPVDVKFTPFQVVG
ncbi:hypothetical protein N0V88_007139 [Collariella sp. IMI 366227]|nr:hypothetical protein N0V88_007139 [Collariella sp. IMI 366227]